MIPEPQSGTQAAFISCPVFEVLLAGERGGGKSWCQCRYQLDGVLRYGKAWKGLMSRKTYPELEQLQSEARAMFATAGGEYSVQPTSERPYSNCYYFPNGATVRMRYIEREEDYGTMHGFQFTGISFDEVTEYATPNGLLKMLSTLRSPEGVPCTVRLTGNPGGVGNAWVKQRYIDVAPALTVYHDPDSDTERLFIPSKLSDNQILQSMDPGYRKRVAASTGADENLRRAWLEGDWDRVPGQFFNNWDRARHVIKPFEIPKHWTRIGGFDWGSRRPFCYLLAAVSDGTVDNIPKDALVFFYENYGTVPGKYNEGLKLDAEVVAKMIADDLKKMKVKVDHQVADPACWQRAGGPPIAERMGRYKMVFSKADNNRITGWDAMRSRFTGDSSFDIRGVCQWDMPPMIYIFETCLNLIRTIPMQQCDRIKPEDIDTKGEDHAVDAARYLCMARPWSRPAPAKKNPRNYGGYGYTFNEVVAKAQRRMRQESEEW